jgi:tetratricopeptide (TPR) repeat protein
MAKIGRNDPCPCGSAKKHKKCCSASGASPVASAEIVPASSPPHHHACDVCGRGGDDDDDDDEIDEINERADHILDEILDGRVDDAEALCHDFIQDFPDDAEGFDLLSMVFEERGQRERALELLRRALGIADANPEYDDETRLLMRERLEELEAPARRRALGQ